MNDIKMYTRLHKSQLIKIYRNMIREKKLFAPKNNDGYGVHRTRQPCLMRPKIEGRVYSWAEFNRMPKAAVVVFVYMNGVDPDYLSSVIEASPEYSFLGEEE
tara:strand:+ start:285 stop:590 length:306 start_codon:yes stop_codon:yes gene_type:complete